jgi:hypothetical protein
MYYLFHFNKTISDSKRSDGVKPMDTHKEQNIQFPPSIHLFHIHCTIETFVCSKTESRKINLVDINSQFGNEKLNVHCYSVCMSEKEQ